MTWAAGSPKPAQSTDTASASLTSTQRRRRNRDRLHGEAVQLENNGLLPEGSAAAIKANLHAADSMEAASAEADYIFEAVPEVESIKLAVLQRISGANGAAVIGTNTSAIAINSLAESITKPERFLSTTSSATPALAA